MVEWKPGLTKTKDILSTLNYKFRWIDWLESGETISSFTIAADTGLTVESSAKADADTSVIVQVSGGQLNNIYRLDCKINATDGQISSRAIDIFISDL